MRILRWLLKTMGEVLAHLPVVLFLVAVCFLLHHTQWYERIEGLSVRLVSAVSNPDPELLGKHGRVIALTATRQFFSEEFDGRLPVNRGKLADLLNVISDKGHPRLIALDINVARTGDTKVERDEAHKLIQAMRTALGKGIDVVATTYPALSTLKPDVRDQRLKDVCDQFADNDPSHPVAGRGRFVLASPMVDLEQPFNLVYRQQRPKENDGNDHRLARAISDLSLNPNDIPHAKASLCPNRQRVGDTLPEPEQMQRIRFTGTPKDQSVTQLPINSMEELRQQAESLSGHVVLVGMQTYHGIDEFLTPIGEVPGVLLHAHMANSLEQPMKQSDVVGTLCDVLIGLIFVLAYVLLRRGHASLSHGKATYRASLLMLLLPLAVFGLMLLGVLQLSAYQFARGQWLDPLPIMAGLALHLYVESGERDHHESPTLSGWFAETAAAWRLSTGRVSEKTATRDDYVLSVIRLVMVAIVLWAFFLIV